MHMKRAMYSQMIWIRTGIQNKWEFEDSSSEGSIHKRQRSIKSGLKLILMTRGRW